MTWCQAARLLPCQVTDQSAQREAEQQQTSQPTIPHQPTRPIQPIQPAPLTCCSFCRLLHTMGNSSTHRWCATAAPFCTSSMRQDTCAAGSVDQRTAGRVVGYRTA